MLCLTKGYTNGKVVKNNYTDMNTLIPIQEAFCPCCGADILKKVTFKRNQFTEKQKAYFVAKKSIIQRITQKPIFVGKEKKDVEEYFASTKVSELSIVCENGHRVGFKINDKTGELLEIVTPVGIEVATPVLAIEEEKKEEIIVPVVPKIVLEEPKFRVQHNKPTTSDFGKVFTPSQEEAWLFVNRHP